MERVLAQAFCQVDVVKGFRYLDDAGKIMNEYDAEFPEKNVGIQGLTMSNKTATLRGLAVSVSRIWLSFFKPDTLQYVLDQSWQRVNKITELTGVTGATRFGFRTENVVPIEDEDAVMKKVGPRVITPTILPKDEKTLRSFGAMAEIRLDDMEAAIRVHLVRKADKAVESELPEQGIMFDIDVYRGGDMLPINEYRAFLRKAIGWLDSYLPTLMREVVGQEVP